MSKLSEHLRLHQTGKALPERNRNLRITSQFEADPTTINAPIREVYYVGVELGCRVIIPNCEGTRINAADVAFAQARELLVNEVFGEFRQPLYEIMDHLLSDNVDAARKGVQDLMHQMFDVQPWNKNSS